MSIVLIGGHERMCDIYQRIGKDRGHKVKVMSKMKTDFSKRIGTPDAILIFTDTVSHKMVNNAEMVAKKKNLLVTKCHGSSQTALESMLEIIENAALMI